MAQHAVAKEEAEAATNKLLSYASWPTHVAKAAHAISKSALPFDVMGDFLTTLRECVLGA